MVLKAPASPGYIHNGRVVQSKPWSFMGLLMAILDLLKLFFATIFTSQSQSSHLNEYNASKNRPSWGKGPSLGKGANIHGLAKPAAAGCSAAGG